MLDDNEFYLTLIRHGESVTNTKPDLMGQEADIPLSGKGYKQAELLRERLSKETLDYVYSSPYKRALDTACIAVAPPSKIMLAPDLREYDAGDWTGASRKATLTPEVKLKMKVMEQAFLPPGGESMHQVERRAAKWLEDNIMYNKKFAEYATNRRNTGCAPLNIFCFSHGICIKSLLHYVMGFSQSFTWKISIDNTSLTKLYFGQDGWHLISVNDCSHLL